MTTDRIADGLGLEFVLGESRNDPFVVSPSGGNGRQKQSRTLLPTRETAGWPAPVPVHSNEAVFQRMKPPAAQKYAEKESMTQARFRHK